MNRFICLLSALLATAATLRAQERIDLWEGTEMPNSRGIEVTDSIANHRVYRVGRPAIYRTAPDPARNRGIAVVICPGGGYRRYAWEISGFDIARRLAEKGITGFVLTARLPESPDVVDPATVGTLDLQRALQLIRANADRWGIDPAKVGIEGFSAGGHLAASAGVAAECLYTGTDAVSAQPCRPDFMILVSPVISMRDGITHHGSRDQLCGTAPTEEALARCSLDEQVDERTPTTLLVHADDDPAVPTENSLRFYAALRAHRIPASLHTFPKGGHAISLENQPAGTELWSVLVERWMDLLYGEQ